MINLWTTVRERIEMAVIKLNSTTHYSWHKVHSKFIGGFRYSHNGLGNEYSLNEKLRYTATARGKYPAKEIIEVIGQDAFVKMIENLWNPSIVNRALNSYDTLEQITMAFKWADTVEGYNYWKDVHDKLRVYRNRRR